MHLIEAAGLCSRSRSNLALRLPFEFVTAKSSFPHAWCSSPDRHLGAGTVVAVLGAARRLRDAAHEGALTRPLRGRNLALLAVAASSAGEAFALDQAAQELGARVAELRFVEAQEAGRSDLPSLARLLGRMYDAIDCGTLAASTVNVIKVESGVPTYAGLGLDDHPAKVLADLMTLCDHQHPSVLPSTICFLGDRETRRGRVFLAAAREVGFRFDGEERAQPTSSESPFVVDATRSSQWSLHGPSAPIDEAHRLANHRFVIQTVLLETIAQA